MSIEAIAFIAVGFIFLFVEVFVLPSFGPVGIFGIILMIAGIIIAGYKEGIQLAVVYAGVTVGVSLPLCAAAFWLMPKTKLGRSLILNTSENGEEGFRSSSDDLKKFVGRTGLTLTPLRPAGTIEIDRIRLDVLTEGEFIEKGKEVEVIRVEGGKITVR